MNEKEFQQLLNQAQAIGLVTFGDLKKFKIEHGCQTNNDLLNAVNETYCNMK